MPQLHRFTGTKERLVLYDDRATYTQIEKPKRNKQSLIFFLHGININSEEFDCRNAKIVYSVQNFILKTKRF